jgi:hypothetical protein
MVPSPYSQALSRQNGDAKLMAGILLWLMGVPLVVILLLYLIF